MKAIGEAMALGIDSFRVPARRWLPMLAWLLLFRFVMAGTLGPLTTASLNAILARSGSTTVTNTGLLAFFTSASGLLAMLLIAVSAAVILAAELCGLVAIALGEDRRLVPALRRAFATVTLNVWPIARTAVALLLVAAAVAVPLLMAMGLIWLTLLSDADINYYLAERPSEFVAAVALAAVVALAGGVVLLAATSRYWLCVGLCVDGHAGGFAALQESARLTRGRRRPIAIVLVAWLAGRTVVLATAFAMLLWINQWLLSLLPQGADAPLWPVALLVGADVLAIAILAALDQLLLAGGLASGYQRITGVPASREAVEAAAPVGPRFWRRAAAIAAMLAVLAGISADRAADLVSAFGTRRVIEVTAHRAGGSAAPENSLAGLRHAIAVGAGWVEIDVQRTIDDRLVVTHDRDLLRLGRSPLVIAQSTLAQLQAIDIGTTHSPAFAGERLATLEDFIDAARGKIRLNVELKYYGFDPRLAERVVAVLNERSFFAESAITSLEQRALEQVRTLAPTLATGEIVTAAIGDITRLDRSFLSLQQSRATPDLIARAHARGLGVHVWTVNDRDGMVRFILRGADNLITDEPALAVETIAWHRRLSPIELATLRFREWLRGL
jgi:glycerophosphoryl diester phosphodiesterase